MTFLRTPLEVRSGRRHSEEAGGETQKKHCRMRDLICKHDQLTSFLAFRERVHNARLEIPPYHAPPRHSRLHIDPDAHVEHARALGPARPVQQRVQAFDDDDPVLWRDGGRGRLGVFLGVGEGRVRDAFYGCAGGTRRGVRAIRIWLGDDWESE